MRTTGWHQQKAYQIHFLRDDRQIGPMKLKYMHINQNTKVELRLYDCTIVAE